MADFNFSNNKKRYSIDIEISGKNDEQIICELGELICFCDTVIKNKSVMFENIEYALGKMNKQYLIEHVKDYISVINMRFDEYLNSPILMPSEVDDG